MKKNSSNTSHHPVVQKSKWDLLPRVLWTEIIFPFVDIKILLDLVKVSQRFHNIANDNKAVFNLFIRKFYYLREFFSKTPAGLKNPLREMGSQLVKGLETYDKKNFWYKANRTTTNNYSSPGIGFGMSCLEISPDLHRKFTIYLEMGDIGAAVTTLVKTSLERGTLSEDLSSLRSHGGQTALGELKKSFKSIPIARMTEDCQKNPSLDKIFHGYILNYSKKLINKNLLDVSFFQLDDKNRAAVVLEKITQFEGITSKEMAQFYVLSYACSQFDFFLKIHAEFKKLPQHTHDHPKYPVNITEILAYCIIYKQPELMQTWCEQILPLCRLHSVILISLSIEYSDPMALHLLLKTNMYRKPLSEVLEAAKNPVFLCQLIRLRKQEFLDSAFEEELKKKINIIELLSVLGNVQVIWFLANWRAHVLKNAQERLPVMEKEFEELMAHFGRQSITDVSHNQDNLILLILKYSPCIYKHAQQILESRQLFRPQVLYAASNLINKKTVLSGIVSTGLLSGHHHPHNLTESRNIPTPRI